MSTTARACSCTVPMSEPVGIALERGDALTHVQEPQDEVGELAGPLRGEVA